MTLGKSLNLFISLSFWRDGSLENGNYTNISPPDNTEIFSVKTMMFIYVYTLYVDFILSAPTGRRKASLSK